MNVRSSVCLFAICVLSIQATAQSSGQAASRTAVDREQDLKSLYQSGTRYEQFLDEAVARRRMWLANTKKATVSDQLLARARSAGGRWHLMAIAVDACSDSANILPYVSELAERVQGVEMRIVNPDRGRFLMERFRTLDGRAATPTIVLLDEGYEIAGAFVERPRGLQEWAEKNRDELSSAEFLRRKFAWYDVDGGRQTLVEVVELIEAAAASPRQ